MNPKVHISLNVNDLDATVRFYSTLFNMQPTKVKPGYAKFDATEPAVNITFNEGHVSDVSGLSHLGIRVESLEHVIDAKKRLESAGFTTSDEMGTTCCYAVQDKIWTTDPTGYRWEVYVFKQDAEQFAASPAMEHLIRQAGAGCKC